SDEIIRVVSDVYQSTDGGTTWAKATAETASSYDTFTKLWDNMKPEDIDKAKDQIKDGNPATDTIDGTSTKHMQGDAKSLSALSSSSAGSGGSTGSLDGTVEIRVSSDASTTVRQI